jgi:uncharacterized protein DUF1189
MKRYSIFHAFVLSFFSKSLYQDVGRYWRGTGLLYLLIVLALVWIPTTIKMHLGINRFVNNDTPRITQQIPKITITNGKVSTDVATPYFIKDPDDGTPLAIIDTTGKYETLDNSPARLLVTRSKVIARSDRDTRIYDLSGVESFYVDRERVEGWLATSKTWFSVVAFPILLISSFALRAIQVLIYALIGMLFARMLNANLDYKTLMRLAAVALTPVLVLNLLIEFVPFSIPLWWLIGTCIGLGYLFFAVKSNTEPPAMPQDQPLVVYPPPGP